MRMHKLAAVYRAGLEGEDQTQATLDDDLLYSDQDALLAALENEQYAARITDSLERDAETLHVLQQMAMVAINEEPTDENLVFADAAGKLATLGHGVDPLVIAPAMECLTTQNAIGMEALSESSKMIMKGILSTISDIWGYLRKFFTSSVDALSGLELRIANQRMRIKALGNRGMQSKTVKIGNEANGLLVMNKLGNNQQILNNNFKQLVDVVKTSYQVDTAGIGRGLAEAIRHVSMDSPYAGVIDTTKAYRRFTSTPLEALLKPGTRDDNRFPKGYRISAPLMGNYSLVQYQETSSVKNDVVRDAQEATGYVVMVTRTRQDFPMTDYSKGEDINTFDLNGIKDTLGHVETLVGLVRDYRRGQLEKIDNAQKAINSALEHVSGQANSPSEKDQLWTLKSFAIGFAKWEQRTSVPLTRVSLQAARAMLMVTSRSLSAYA